MLVLLLIVLWILLLLLLRKLKIYFFVFVAGSVGMFLFVTYLGRDFLERQLEMAVTYSMWFVGNLTRLFNAYPQYSMITLYYRQEAISFFVDYECSGFIEMIVFISLLTFYPIYRWKGKLALAAAGTVYIYLSNVLRVFAICVIVKLFGPTLFFFSHTIFARLLFFFLTVTLYYVVFTRPHIIRQKVGNMVHGS